MASQPFSTSVVLDNDQPQHYVDWQAVLGGVAVASGISIVLFAFGSAIGLSMVSPFEGEGVSRVVYFGALGLWTLWVILASVAAGAYIAGRLRKRIGDATEHEVDVRDGAHGLIVWGVGVLVAALLLVIGVAGVLGTGTRLAAAMLNDDRNDVVAYTTDSLFRAPDRAGSAVSDADRREVGRMLTQGTVRGELNDADRMYLSQLIAARTSLSQAQAEMRVNEVLAEARRKADAARKLGVVVGFFTAASLALAAAVAAWAAMLGGRHRDRSVDTSDFWRWR